MYQQKVFNSMKNIWIFLIIYCQSAESLFGDNFPVHPLHDDGGTGFISCGSRTVDFNGASSKASSWASGLASNSASVREAKIVGGAEAPYGAFPWQVEIKKLNLESGQFEHHCGGAVVGARTFLTAAHCFDQPPLQLESFRLVLGDHQLLVRDKHEHSFRLRKVVVHPDFRKAGPHSNDIAVVSVGVGAGGVPFSSHIRPICLPHTANSLTGGACAVTGWGAVNEGTEAFSPVLRAASVPIVDPATCRMLGVYGGRQQPILDTMICAGVLQGGIDACGGDSGGPLSCERDGRHELLGLVSWGDGCAKRNRPGVYTNVYSYVSWIRGTMKLMGEAV